MWLLIAIILSTHAMRVLPRRHDSSSESIENILYYKDCQHNSKTTTEITNLRSEIKPTPYAPRQPDCPFPKMCCSMSCGNDCGNPQSYLTRQMGQMGQMDPMHPNIEPIQPQQSPHQPMPMQPHVKQMKNKKGIQPLKLPPIGGRRHSGYTKDRIKSLISQDEDIRKILKDLVRVSMQKVDLIEMIDNQGSNIENNNDLSANSRENE